jgi:uncharacterized membrane protein YeiH
VQQALATNTLLDVIFYVATIVVAMTAALSAGRRKMDWFGVCVLACVTALGGGSVRDILLDHYPLAWVKAPYLLFICCGAALLTIALARFMHRLAMPFLILDGLGLVALTIIGADIALASGHSPIIAIVAGMITGIAGGILRDILCNDVPLVFSSELYATVSIVTGAVYLIGLSWGINHDVMILGSIAIGFALRLLAIVLKLDMPKFVYDEDMR